MLKNRNTPLVKLQEKMNRNEMSSNIIADNLTQRTFSDIIYKHFWTNKDLDVMTKQMIIKK